MMLDQISFDKLNVQWKQELFSRISPETYYLVEEFLASELYGNYTQAVHAATLAMTRPLSDLMNFVLTEKKGETN
jgi:predicted transcriptional regulator